MSVVRVVRPARAVEWTGSNQSEVEDFVDEHYGLVSSSVDDDVLTIANSLHPSEPETANVGDSIVSDATGAIVRTPTQFADEYSVLS
jgi:hypothetical protein